MQLGDQRTIPIAAAARRLALALLVAASVQAAPTIPPLAVSPTSGIAPLSVHFDATGTTDSAFPRAFHSLHYEWSFGDPQSGTWTHSGRSKNAATGAVAAHLFERPGSYPVTLTVRNPQGETAIATTNVTVTDPSTVFPASATYCYANPGRSFAGCPRPCPSASCVTTSSVGEAFEGRLAAGTRHYFRRGDSFALTHTVFITGDGSQVLISSFGSGPKPVFATDLGSEYAQAIAASSDWRVGGITLTGTSGVALANNGGGLSRVTYWDIDARGFGNCYVLSGFGHSLIGIYDLTCTEQRPTEGHTWLFYDHSDRASYQGIYIDGTGNPSANGLFRTVGSSRSVISHNVLHAAHQQGVINLRSCGAGTQPGCTAGMPNRFLQISDNRFVAASAIPLRTCTVDTCAHTGSNGNDAIDFIWERNYVTLAEPGTTVNILWWIEGGDQTFRNNVIDLSGAEADGGAHVILEQSGPTSPGGANRNRLHFVNNTIVSTTALPQLVACSYTQSGGSGHQCRNNLIYAPLAGSTRVAEPGDWADSNNLASFSPALPFQASLPAIGARQPSDFQLAANAAAIDAGFDMNGTSPVHVATDAFQGCRPAGSGWDVGADERGASPCFSLAVPEPPVLLE